MTKSLIILTLATHCYVCYLALIKQDIGNMFPIAGKPARPNGLKFSEGTQGYPGIVSCIMVLSSLNFLNFFISL